ncbi:JAB domain-containing protein [Parabacteroides sp. BX2]|jgi:DNA repair protein RadC|uniref:JAB domain-containing protein n=1 Tax=Parabacteroides segnis TaxID=2763058 RepID=A0ABR7E1E6_9BACT|nr:MULTISPECIES: JAB domain-containing protein [Parabacteroides]MBC5643562.1 JAB domain-containing protein [Parabacteroides segnis]MCM0713550.1 JAB domain-containing protein [Parabacteroides sp. TA-V-105]
MENVLKVCDVKLTYKTKVKSSERPVIVLAEDVYRLLIDYVYDKEIIQYKECLKLILLNKAGKLLGVAHISEGGIDETSADIRIIMQAAILGNASSIILTHNHPSGNLKPSTQDDLVTENLRKAAKLFNITLLDHIIVTDSGYFSYLDEGRVL